MLEQRKDRASVRPCIFSFSFAKGSKSDLLWATYSVVSLDSFYEECNKFCQEKNLHFYDELHDSFDTGIVLVSCL